MMRRFSSVGTLLAATLASASGQSATQAPARLEFEAATIKPADPPSPNDNPPERGPGRVTYRYGSIRNLLMTAYGLPLQRVLGPPWIDSERYDVVAKVPPGATKEQVNVMLQNLLADRFKLRVHAETKELPLYELVVGRSGSKLKDSDPNASGGRSPRFVGRNYVVTNPKATMAELVEVINAFAFLDRLVVDRTRMTGTYDLKFTYTPDTPGNRKREPNPNDISIFTAVQEQLGLRLEAKTGPVDVLVVDQGEKTPTEN
jgi:uncharacterized protein (TIGR03435 family)